MREVAKLREGKYVPLFGAGATAPEAARVLAILAKVFHRDADAQSAEYALAMATHPALGAQAHRYLAESITARETAAWMGALALGYVTVLGANDGVREEVAGAYRDVAALGGEVTLALRLGGGERGTWRERYPHLRVASQPAAVQIGCHWFDFVLARRFSGLDGLAALGQRDGLDSASKWLLESALWASGDDSARDRMTVAAESVLLPLAPAMPRLLGVVAREMSELLMHPGALRWAHLQCAAARDHAAAAIKHWLHAASEAEVEDVGDLGVLGPEPSRAGRAAVPARQVSEEFLLDWFVPARDARVAVDQWAHKALRTYHRLRGAGLLTLGRDALGRDGA